MAITATGRRPRSTRRIRRIALIYDATRTYDTKVMSGVAAEACEKFAMPNT